MQQHGDQQRGVFDGTDGMWFGIGKIDQVAGLHDPGLLMGIEFQPPFEALDGDGAGGAMLLGSFAGG